MEIHYINIQPISLKYHCTTVAFVAVLMNECLDPTLLKHIRTVMRRNGQDDLVPVKSCIIIINAAVVAVTCKNSIAVVVHLVSVWECLENLVMVLCTTTAYQTLTVTKPSKISELRRK